jgi:DNA polymerase-1
MIKFVGGTPLIESQFATATVEEVMEFLERTLVIGVDTETIGNCWTGYIYTLQLGNADVQYVIDATLIDVRIFNPWFERKDKLFLLQNAKYDIKFFIAAGVSIPTNVYDTFLVECIITNGLKDRELRLDKIVTKYCGNKYNLDKTIRGKINYAGLTDEVIKYAAEDVIALEEVMNGQMAILEQWDLTRLVELENRVMVVFAEMEYYGMKLDINQWLAQATTREVEAHKYEDSLNQYILANPEKYHKFIDNQLDLFCSELKTNVNWSSPKQVLDILSLDKLKIESVNEKIIEKFRKSSELIDLYLQYKENQIAVSKFGKEFLKWVNPKTKSIHTSYWQILQTGRVSSGQKDEAPNMQQIPALNEVRNCFVAREGYSFVDCDYSAMELVIAGCVSGEDSWIEAFNNGYDLHSVVAEAVYKDKWIEATEENCLYKSSKQKCSCGGHKKMRDKIKTLNYLSLYGGGPQKLSDSINIPLAEAKEVIAGYFKGLPKLTKFLNSLKAYGKKHGYIRTKSPYGRVRFFEPHNGDFAKIGEIERQSGNSFIQGTGADITKLAMVKMHSTRRMMELTKDDIKFVLQLHDAIVCEVRDDLAKDWKRIMVNCMVGAFEDVIGYQIDVDGYIEKYWKK